MNTILCGLSYGDEGKGHITNLLAESHDAVIRYSGSCNTGASVVINGFKYKFHHIPVGVLQNKPCYMGAACIVNPEKLRDEMNKLRELGFDVDNLLKLSPDCHVITSDHVARDCAAEGVGGVGSTKQGVSPASSDKYGRKGVKLGTLKEFERYFADVPRELNNMIGEGKSLLFEGSQGTLLDIDHGLDYPYISTTSNVSGAACCSCGVGPTNINRVIGVTKAYVTKVSTKGFPTEIEPGQVNDDLVERGHEYGTTTGRRRRVGWLSLPDLRYACMINGVTELALTKSDVLVGMRAKYCVGYELDGQVTDQVPMLKSDYWRCVPVYREMDVKTGREFIPIIEDAVGIPVKYFSWGQNRHEIEEL